MLTGYWKSILYDREELEVSDELVSIERNGDLPVRNGEVIISEVILI